MKSFLVGALITLILFTLLGLTIYFKESIDSWGMEKAQPQLATVAGQEIQRAMLKMGPMKRYRIVIRQQLQVYQDGQWLNIEMEGDDDSQ